MKEKLDGVLLDGRWQFIGCENNMYLFENIYNGAKTQLSYKQVNNVLNGRDSVSKIHTRRLGKDTRENSPNWWCNNVSKSYINNIKKNK